MNYTELFSALQKATNANLANEMKFLIDDNKHISTAFQVNGRFGRQCFIFCENNGDVGCSGTDVLRETATVETCILPKKKREVQHDIKDNDVLYVCNDEAYKVESITFNDEEILLTTSKITT
jgi:hypothetical protein